MGAWCSTPAAALPWPQRPAQPRRQPQPQTPSTEQIFDNDALVQHVKPNSADRHYQGARLNRAFRAWQRHQTNRVATRKREAARWLHKQATELRNGAEEVPEPVKPRKRRIRTFVHAAVVSDSSDQTKTTKFIADSDDPKIDLKTLLYSRPPELAGSTRCAGEEQKHPAHTT